MLRVFFSGFALLVVAVFAFAGLRGSKSEAPPIQIFPDMDHQPKFQPQHPNRFFPDGRSGRQPVTGTVPMGYGMPGSYLQVGAKNGTLRPEGFTAQPDYLNTGVMGDSFGDGLPVQVTPQLLQRGRERFEINCAVCHGQLAMGNGIVGAYGLAAIANLQLDVYRTMPDGQIFYTITNGKGNMGAYGPNIAVEDRWAIVSYVRALQRTQTGKLADLPPDQQQALQQAK